MQAAFTHGGAALEAGVQDAEDADNLRLAKDADMLGLAAKDEGWMICACKSENEGAWEEKCAEGSTVVSVSQCFNDDEQVLTTQPNTFLLLCTHEPPSPPPPFRGFVMRPRAGC